MKSGVHGPWVFWSSSVENVAQKHIIGLYVRNEKYPKRKGHGLLDSEPEYRGKARSLANNNEKIYFCFVVKRRKQNWFE